MGGKATKRRPQRVAIVGISTLVVLAVFAWLPSQQQGSTQDACQPDGSNCGSGSGRRQQQHASSAAAPQIVPDAPHPPAEDVTVVHVPASDPWPGGGEHAGAAQQDGADEDEGKAAAVPFDLLDPERVKRLPHVDECRVCKVCVPLEEEQRLTQQAGGGRDSGPAGGGGGSGGGGAGAAESQQRLLSLRRRRRERRLRRLQHAAAAAADAAGAAAGSPAAQPSGARRSLRADPPALDGVRTHEAWVAAHGGAAGVVGAAAAPGIEVVTSYANTTFEWDGNSYSIAPGSMVHAAGQIRTCPVCRGCRHELRWMPKGASMLGSYFKHETGASPGWLLRVKSNRSRTGEAAVKVWCVPLRKPGATGPPSCKPDKIRSQLQIVLAQQRVAEECGLLDVLPAHWVGKLDGVLPASGYRINWDGLWAELSAGASLENVVHRGAPPAVPAAVLDLLKRRLSKSDVISAAIFDLLTSQCDRHAQNVYVSRDGRLSLIDNDQAYGSSWRACGVDSIFLPGTQKHEIARLGFKYVMKSPRHSPEAKPQAGASPLQLLDYRCHAPGGEIGTSYPPQVSRCLRNISSMSKQEVLNRYGFPTPAAAAALRRRAIDMLSKGFEATLRGGWPRNPVPLRYRWSPPCCDVEGEQARPDARPVYACAGGGGGGGGAGGGSGGSGGSAALPRGEPYFGGPWREKARDTGTYELGADGGEVDSVGGGSGGDEGRGIEWPKEWVAGAWLGDDDGAGDPGYAPAVQANMYN